MSARLSARTSWKRAALLAVGGAVAAVLLIELAVRIATGSLSSLGGPNSQRYGITDPVLGRIPKPGVSMRHPTKGYTVTIGAHGTRNNGATEPRADRPLTLALGDSFAFGDDVDDAGSWPAQLEHQLGRQVVNAAVPGFGIDQMVLRAEQLAGVYAPETIVVGFIPHDVLRCEMSYWQGLPKPYFEIDAAGLRLHALPPASPVAFARLKRWLAASVTLDLLFPYFLHGEGPAALAVHQQGAEVACRLMARLAELGRVRGARIVILAQPQAPDTPPEYLALKDRVLACAAANGLATLDLFPVFGRLSPEERAALFEGHLTVAGNRLVATELARFLEPGGRPAGGTGAPQRAPTD